MAAPAIKKEVATSRPIPSRLPCLSIFNNIIIKFLIGHKAFVSLCALSHCVGYYSPFLTLSFRPRHVLHSVPIPTLITSHTSIFLMYLLSFSTISKQVWESYSS